jgi:heme-degrading monooxygenase HmoA
MYVRLIRVQGSTDRAQQEAAQKTFLEQFVPPVQKAAGYAGFFLGIDRASGVSCSVTYWQDEAAASASAPSQELLQKAEQALNCKVEDVDTLEMVYLERVKAPAPGVWMRSNDARDEALDVEARLKTARERLYPLLSGQAGFRTLALAVNRETGRIVVSSTWDTREHMERSEAALGDIRAEARDRGLAARVERWEIPAIEILAPSPVRS